MLLFIVTNLCENFPRVRVRSEIRKWYIYEAIKSDYAGKSNFDVKAAKRILSLCQFGKNLGKR